MRYAERLTEADIAPSVGSVGDSYDNALAESVIGRFKTQVIQRLGPWKSFEAFEYKTPEWVAWFNQRTPAGAYREHPARRGGSELPRDHRHRQDGRVELKPTSLRQTQGGSLPAGQAPHSNLHSR
jgi:transposase InsO family protein